ncbi:FlaA1/EpsC-like NDP-sugar epimerase [Bradyrhizobium elkanii]
MSYAFFTNSPAPTERSAHSVPDRKAIAADVGKNRLAALLVLAAGAEFLLVAVGAFAAAVLYYRLVLQLDYPDTPKYILESLLIATLQLLVSVGLRQYSRIQTQPRHTFLWSGVSAVFFVFSFFISTIFLLKISDGYSRATVMAQAASVIVMVLFARAICFSLLQPAIASGLIDARRVILIGEPSPLLEFFRTSKRHRNPDHSFVRFADLSHRLFSARALQGGRSALPCPRTDRRVPAPASG